MPSYDSKRGMWFPAKENTYVDYSQSKFRANKGRKSFHHEGPDRAAVDHLKEVGEEYLGMDVANDPQLLEVAQKYNITVEEYLKRFTPTAKQEAVKKVASEKINDHAIPTGKPGVKPQGGGVTQKGQFADEGDMPA